MAPRQTQVEMTFLVVDTPSPYNAIVGRPGLNLVEAIVSTRHLLMKFPTRFGVGEVRGDQQAARQCYKTAISDKGKDKVLPIANVELRGDVEPERPQPVEDVLQVLVEEGNNEKVFQVGSQLEEAEKEEFYPREAAGNSRGGEQAIADRVHKGSALLRLDGEPSASQKSKRQVEDVHRLHIPQQSLSKGSLPSSKDRLAGGCNLGLQNIKLLGRLLRI
ncbi:hypothetical protein CFOL_v3_11412 [Cephalotus follicularis]|uniref:Uncharacterized protein n=1 Tax=Cephalotus follicularis TaxID=3775 RepID=A0A1Q3BJ46_CEPFO|nr:hypothetical protein CFOL_v3_11412 [Cephalotus follicularis]